MRNKYLLIIGLMLLPVACDLMPEIYYQFRSFPQSEWNVQEEIRFEVSIDDTTEHYNVYIIVRNTDKYNFSSIRLIVDILNTDHTTQTDSLHVQLADSNGRWYGTGISLYDVEIPYQTNIQYPDSGVCVYTIRQGMAENPLQGISDVGLLVVRN
ncbi:gliding motility-associated lipoprotein GldH [Candidatus Symbiothrix dinenymphae]|nr:gliding motility-associated lipoprotein GldH [Candidatus Symbiothrix dinenymphae]